MQLKRLILGSLLPLLVASVCTQSASAALIHRYSFTADATDSQGSADGELINGPVISDGAVTLDGVDDYINLPNGLLASLTNITIEIWLTDNGSGNWARIYDFGSSSGGEDFPTSVSPAATGTQYMFLTPRSSGGALRGAYTITGSGAGEQVVEWTGNALSGGVLKHVVWTSDNASQTAKLYVDGVLVGSNEGVTLTPADIEPSINNWIGRSQFSADNFLKASITEFRIYDAALNAFQIAVNAAAGPNEQIGDPGPLESITLHANAAMVLGSAQPATATGNYADLSNVSLQNQPGVNYASSDTNVVSVTADGVLTAREIGQADISVSYQGFTDAVTIQVSAPPQTLIHRYSFDASANDSEGTADGTLAGGATVNSGQVLLNGSSAYVDLPNNLVADLTSLTFEAWGTDNGSSGWARLWDIGNSSGGEGNQGGGTSYMFLAWPLGAGTGMRGCYKLEGQPEQILDISPRPANNTPHHIVWTQDGPSHTARIYVDGVLAGENTSFTYTPAAVGSTVNDWLGRSQYNDPYFNGSIDEFRVYNAALTPQEVAQNYQLGPDLSPQSGPVTITRQPQNLTVDEQHQASFSVEYRGTRPVLFQWFKNGSEIPDATNATYRIPAAQLIDNHAEFTVALTNSITNTTFFAVSDPAVLTVVTDTVPPVVLRAFNIGETSVAVVFSEPVETASATTTANYVFVSGATVTAAQLADDLVTVTLTTTPLTYGSEYLLVINAVRDRATTPNTVATDTTLPLLATPYAPVDIGGATPPGTLAAGDNGYDVVASGGDIGSTADQFHFDYRRLTGDFDVQVRLAGLTPTDLWAKAGLMARETLDPGSPFAAVLATPTLAGSFFEYRLANGGKAATVGSMPVNFPYQYLRLQRAGDQFNGYASYDGQVWTLLGTETLTVGNSVYFGMAAASHVNGTSTTVQFRELVDTTSTTVGTLPDVGEPLGPSSRRTGLVISEIMYRPATRLDARDLEFVEIYNSNPFYHDISGHRLSGDIDYTFPQGTIIPAAGFVVVAANPADVEAVYGLSDVFGPYTNRLAASGTVRLRDEQDTILLEVSYRSTNPWPMGADGTGHSIVLARPSYGEADPRAWAISDVVGGSPGAWETYHPSPLRRVVINEVLANAGAMPAEDYVELYNHSNQEVDLSGCILSDNPAENKFVIPTNTVIAARGFLVFQQSQLGFGLKSSGDTIYFKNSDASRVLDAVRFDAQATGMPLGRWPDGAADLYPMAAQSPGAANGAYLMSDIVINELMYHPLSNDNNEQYVELFNQGLGAVNLGGWRFVDGIDYQFAPDTILSAGGYLVVAENLTNLLAKYPQLNATNAVGNFGGRLSFAGERVALARPEFNYTTNALGAVTTNILYVTVDEVSYVDGGRWGEWSDGGGSSLELIDPRANHRLPSNWSDSDETAKAPWTTIETTGVLDNGENYAGNPIGYAQLGQLDAGECLVDNVEVHQGTGANIVANPDFEAGLTNWSLQGCFSRSRREADTGVGGSAALHLRTANRVFTAANSAQCALSSTSLGAGQTATLRFQARWLRGTPDILFRLNGNWLEAAGRMTVPANLGTPGLPNSRAVANAGPAVYAVMHTPSMPLAGQAARVTARVDDPDGLQDLTLQYRLDPAPDYTSVPMIDDGSGGDAVAGDGVFSAMIPGQAAGRTVAFLVTATDLAGASARFPAWLNSGAPVRECIVRFGEPDPASSFGIYHLWLTQTNVDRWINLPVLSNEDIDSTVVYGPRVIYNAFARYAGSPYHQSFNSPFGNPCHYNWSMPDDDKLLGHTSFNKIHWIGNDIQDDTPTQNNNDATLQREQAANTFLRGLGQPWIYRRYVGVYVNGHRRGQLMEDALRPSISVPDAYFPNDSDGLLYKFQPWFECGPEPQANGFMPWENKEWSLFMPYKTTGGAYKKERYRWTYQLRETPDTWSNYDYLFDLVTAGSAYTDPHYAANMENLADMENWMRLVAANHAAGNWDCWGIQNEQNIYGYVSPAQRWKLFMFDFSIVLGNRISWGPGQNLEYIVPGNSGAGFAPDINWQRIYANPTSANPGNPTFRRMYWRALKELVNGAMAADQIDPLLEAKYAAFLANGLTAADPQVIETWVASARTSIASQVAAWDAADLTLTTNSLTTSSNLITLSGTAPLERQAAHGGRRILDADVDEHRKLDGATAGGTGHQHPDHSRL